MTDTTTLTPDMHSAILWPHRLVFNSRYGRWISALLLFAAMFAPFYLFNAINDTGDEIAPLFFCLVVAYIIPASHYINEQSVIVFDSLKSALDLDDEEREQTRNSLLKIPVRTQLKILTIGLFAGCIHDYLLISSAGELNNLLNLDIRNKILMLDTIFIWILLATTLSFLIRNANIFAHLARNNVKINLLDTSSLKGFARVAVYSTLLLIGALAAFPVLLLDEYTKYITIVPGLLSITIPMVFIFLIPLLPIRKRIKDKKLLELTSIQIAINQLTTGSENLPADGERLGSLQPLLDYRREIKQVSEWPFDSTVMFRLLFYLIIPPLTWVGAALIERVVDTVNF